MWSGKFMVRFILKVYDILQKITCKFQRIMRTKLLRRSHRFGKNAQKNGIQKSYTFSKKRPFFFQITKEVKIEKLPKGDARKAWGKSQESYNQPQGIPRQ